MACNRPKKVQTVFVIYGVLDNVFQGIKDVRTTQEKAVTAAVKWVMRQVPSPDAILFISDDGVETQDGLIQAKIDKRVAI